MTPAFSTAQGCRPRVRALSGDVEHADGSSKNQTAAKQLLRWITSKEVYQTRFIAELPDGCRPAADARRVITIAESNNRNAEQTITAGIRNSTNNSQASQYGQLLFGQLNF